MSTRLTCPGCGRTLLLPADVTAETLSCPRCLALIPNPQAPAASSTAVQTAVPSAPPPPAPSTHVTERGAWPPHADVDVRRDSRQMSGCMIALAVLGGIGVFTLLWSGLAGGPGDLVIVLVVLSVPAFFSALWVAAHPRPGADGSQFGVRTVLGALIIIGVIVLFLMACLIFLFVVCLVNPPRFH